ncbi:hypothetical protein [Streptomyces sp. Y1]|uniref:Uncharacterized protein n=1 Tax=Streptomyces sp. Y1 TaxID=3238634 RepID=A0AB39TBQ2_9ACTN
MDSRGGLAHVRPVGGGVERTALPARIEPLPDGPEAVVAVAPYSRPRGTRGRVRQQGQGGRVKRRPRPETDVLVAICVVGALSGAASAAAAWAVPGPPRPTTALVCLLAFASALNSGVVLSEPVLHRAAGRRNEPAVPR